MSSAHGALDGVRVLELARFQAGPRGGMLLSDLGAEVIKIERFGGEETRKHPPMVRGQSVYFTVYNRGKKSVCLDLRSDEGKRVFAEGFTLGVKAGVKPEAILEAIKGASFGQGLLLTQMLPNVIFKGDFDTVRFACKLARKDIGLATALAREIDVPMPIAAVAEQIMMEAIVRGLGDKDSTVPWILQEEAAGVQVRESKT